MLRSLGYSVYDSDLRTKELYRESPTLLQELEELTQRSLRDPDGNFVPALLSEAIFSSGDMLGKVEATVHPQVRDDFRRWVGDMGRGPLPEGGYPLCFMESAIALSKPLFGEEFEGVVMVEAPLETRIQRCLGRDSTTREKVLSRIRRQSFPPPSCPMVRVWNDSTREELPHMVEEALGTLCATLRIAPVTKEKTVTTNISTHKVMAENNIPVEEQQQKTDLSKILSVPGHSGLYRFLAQARSGFIVENLQDGKRTRIDARVRLSSLADISIYTHEDELKLMDVFEKMHAVLGEEPAPSSKSDPEDLKEFFSKAVENYDEGRFYVSHMKKVVDWYNLLKDHASLDFLKEEEQEESPAQDAPAQE